ncbi:MAG: hypothetical protein ACO1Q7_01810 [Gemmatimonas sp.]
MRTRQKASFALVIPAIALGAYSMMAASPPPVAPACTVTVDSIKTGEASTTVKAKLSEEVGDSLSASVAPASKITINSVRKSGEPMTGELVLNSEQAVAGSWDLTVTGPKGTCAGTIGVVAPK